MSDRKARKTYDREFKISAVKLVLDSGRTVSNIFFDIHIFRKPAIPPINYLLPLSLLSNSFNNEI